MPGPRRRPRRVLLVPGLLLLPLIAGCGGEDAGEGGDVTPEQARERVVAASRDVASTLADEGPGEVADLGGAWTVCGSPPAEAVEYRASGVLRGAGAPQQAIPVAAEALTAAGWDLTGEGSDPQPWANLERDGTTVSLRVDPRAGSEGVAVAVADACVPVGDGESSDYDFDREPIETS